MAGTPDAGLAASEWRLPTQPSDSPHDRRGGIPHRPGRDRLYTREGERELVAAYVSGLNGCRYCHGVHTATAEWLGIESGAAASLLDGGDTGAIPDKMRPVLNFAKKLTRRADGVTQSDVDAVFAIGWNETAVYHPVAVVALFNYMNRLVEGLGIELNPAYAQTAAKRLADRGYRPLIEMMRRPFETTGKSE